MPSFGKFVRPGDCLCIQSRPLVEVSIGPDFDASACIPGRLGYTSLFPEFRLPVCLVGRITVSKLKFLILQGL